MAEVITIPETPPHVPMLINYNGGNHMSELPFWSNACKTILLMQPSSAAAGEVQTSCQML